MTDEQRRVLTAAVIERVVIDRSDREYVSALTEDGFITKTAPERGDAEWYRWILVPHPEAFDTTTVGSVLAWCIDAGLVGDAA